MNGTWGMRPSDASPSDGLDRCSSPGGSGVATEAVMIELHVGSAAAGETGCRFYPVAVTVPPSRIAAGKVVVTLEEPG
jgi:hypothetical protein